MGRRRGTYLARGVVQQPLEVRDAKVRDTNVLHLARLRQLLHLLPRVDVVPALMVLLQVLGRRAARPVNQVQINIVQPQALQARVDALRHALVPRVVELGGDPDLGARDARVADGGADLGLVAVGEGGVDVAVAGLEGGEDGVVDLVGGGLPGAEADDGDLGARVEGRGAPGGVLAGVLRGQEVGKSWERFRGEAGERESSRYV